MGGVRDQTWEHVTGEGKRELGRAGREKQKKKMSGTGRVFKAGKD